MIPRTWSPYPNAMDQQVRMQGGGQWGYARKDQGFGARIDPGLWLEADPWLGRGGWME